jgi:polar amino acid transport system substrate-binding protein
VKWLACGVCVMAAAMALAASASARTLAEIQARGAISLCANPDALPYASNQSDKPGFQIEIARALAEALGVKLQVDWIVPRVRAGLVDCDMLLDTIVDPDLARGPIKVSHAYQLSGVALALAPGNDGIRRFSDIAPGKRVGVMVNSVASKLLNQRGIYTVPYAFESEMIADLVKGDLEACAVSPATIAYYLHAHPSSGLRYVHAYDAEPELKWKVAVGLRRSDDALVNAVNDALDRLIRDGMLARVYAKYGVDYRQP